MLFLDKFRLETILKSRGLSLNKLSDSCGISRQTIYNMFEEFPVFNTTFEKIREFLNVDYRAITVDSTVAHEIIKKAPDRIKIAAYVLTNFAQETKSDLLLFSSEGKTKFGKNFDWNFAIKYKNKEVEKKIPEIRQDLIERVAPYHIEIIDLNKAQFWFKLIVKNNYIRLYGNSSEEILFYSER